MNAKDSNHLKRINLVNPAPNLSFREKLIRSNAPDLYNNSNIISLDSGYIKIEAIDTSKRVR